MKIINTRPTPFYKQFKVGGVLQCVSFKPREERDLPKDVCLKLIDLAKNRFDIADTVAPEPVKRRTRKVKEESDPE